MNHLTFSKCGCHRLFELDGIASLRSAPLRAARRQVLTYVRSNSRPGRIADRPHQACADNDCIIGVYHRSDRAGQLMALARKRGAYTLILWNVQTKRERCTRRESLHCYLQTRQLLVDTEQLLAQSCIRILEVGVRVGSLTESILKFLDAHRLPGAESFLRKPVARFPVL